jgi:hypothetical protein
MEAHAHDDVTLARVRSEFDRWRAGRSGGGRIPDRLWRLAISLLDSFSTAVVCKELRLSAGDLRKRREAFGPASTLPPAAPAFVELRAVDLVPHSPHRSPSADESSAAVRAVLERADGARLTLELPSAAASAFEALVTAFIRR